jgi:hypothetical protein
MCYPNPPESSSFPSAHAASVAAFTSALGLESRLLGVVVAPVAAVVAYSLVRTWVHWPTDSAIAGAGGVGRANVVGGNVSESERTDTSTSDGLSIGLSVGSQD